ncbi:hypothetical protein ABZ478_34925 [Streptomyces sp. NPDC005706]|uniref:hypothetical protein n=1 Tax=Streptomyces sp. NPDC005706 TaxID=3157169 RepID=UPI0033F88E2E
MIVLNSVWVPGVMVGTVGPEALPAWRVVLAVDAVEEAMGAAAALVCRPDSETAAAPVLKPTALLKVRLLIMRSLPSCDSGGRDRD